jgi:hypothetical protein
MTANAIVTWTTSPEHSDYIETGLWRSTIRAWFAVVLSIASGAWLSYTQGRPGQSALGITGLFVSGCVALWSIAPYWAARRAYFERVQAEKSQAVQDALDHLAGQDSRDALPLTALFIFNRRQLDEYQNLTKWHAEVSFRNAQIAAGLGFTVLVVGAALVIQQKTASTSVQYAIGGLSTLGALLSTYLSRTYFRSHQEAMTQLAIYYEEPFITSRALSAERIISRIPSLGVPPTDTNIAILVQRLLNPTASLASDQPEQVNHSSDLGEPASLGKGEKTKREPHWWPWRRRPTAQ